jgi:hypothetical protein
VAKYIAGHTGKIEYTRESTARWIAKHNKFKQDMRAYKCTAGGYEHWHLTTYTKAMYRVATRRLKK